MSLYKNHKITINYWEKYYFEQIINNGKELKKKKTRRRKEIGMGCGPRLAWTGPVARVWVGCTCPSHLRKTKLDVDMLWFNMDSNSEMIVLFFMSYMGDNFFYLFYFIYKIAIMNFFIFFLLNYLNLMT